MGQSVKGGIRRSWWLAQALVLMTGAMLLLTARSVARSPLSRLKRAKDAGKKAVDTRAVPSHGRTGEPPEGERAG
ncbi:MAG: hypothetical protein R2909_11710 [Gemmatimonadales bacterium]